MNDASIGSTRFTLQDIEDAHIVAVLDQTLNYSEAARLLGISVITLWRKRQLLKKRGKLPKEHWP